MAKKKISKKNRKWTAEEEKAEFKMAKEWMDKHKARRKATLKYADGVSKRLTVASGDDTSVEAEFLAKICHQIDHAIEPAGGPGLCLEWMLDHYVAMIFKKNHDKMKETYELLVSRGHTERNKFSYFNLKEAFYIPDPGKNERMIFVMGNSCDRESRNLVVLSNKSIFTDEPACHVREVWRRTRLDCIGGIDRPTLTWYKEHDFEGEYRDARDRGHVLTIGGVIRSQADKVIWDVSKPLWWFFYMNSLWKQICEAERLSVKTGEDEE